MATLDPEQRAAYFALMEVSSLLQHALEQQLRKNGGVSFVQFQILARLSDTPEGRHRMTDLADAVVYSRSGLTYQASLLEKSGLITRQPSNEDERSVTVTITPAGRELVDRVMPGHVEVVQAQLLESLDKSDLSALSRVLSRVRDRMRTSPPRSAACRGRQPQQCPS